MVIICLTQGVQGPDGPRRRGRRLVQSHGNQKVDSQLPKTQNQSKVPTFFNFYPLGQQNLQATCLEGILHHN